MCTFNVKDMFCLPVVVYQVGNVQKLDTTQIVRHFTVILRPTLDWKHLHGVCIFGGLLCSYFHNYMKEATIGWFCYSCIVLQFSDCIINVFKVNWCPFTCIYIYRWWEFILKTQPRLVDIRPVILHSVFILLYSDMLYCLTDS